MKKYIFLLLLFAVLEISLALYLTFWREHFWNAIGNKEKLDFLTQLGIFTLVALGCCFVSGISGYLLNLATIKWREILDSRIRNKKIGDIENLAQRWQEDCTKYPELILGLSFGTCKALIYVLVFSTSLIMSFNWMFLLILIAYASIGSLLAKKVAYPLIKLNYSQQKAEATYRQDLSIYNFQECICLMLGIAKRTKKLTYFQQFYMQVGVIVPLVIIAPTYFSTTMTLGHLMRFNSLSSTILENMSYGINSWGSINMLISCRRRLKEIGVI